MQDILILSCRLKGLFGAEAEKLKKKDPWPSQMRAVIDEKHKALMQKLKDTGKEAYARTLCTWWAPADNFPGPKISRISRMKSLHWWRLLWETSLGRTLRPHRTTPL
jgi:hypothetical protein